MQAYEVELVPAQNPPLRIRDAIRADARPYPHVAVGDAAAPEEGLRVPITARLMASCTPEAPSICRAAAYRDPKSGKIVLGVEQGVPENGARALVLFSASSSFPEGVSVTLPKGMRVLGKGPRRNGQQLLVIWPDDERILVADPGREERYEVRRTGDQFGLAVLTNGG
jgi:hypothetical protein